MHNLLTLSFTNITLINGCISIPMCVIRKYFCNMENKENKWTTCGDEIDLDFTAETRVGKKPNDVLLNVDGN